MADSNTATVASGEATLQQAATPEKALAAPKQATNQPATQPAADLEPPNLETPNLETPNLETTDLADDVWVCLRQLPSDFSHHEALLLCETGADEWVSWVPGYGELKLRRDQFS